MSFGQQVFIVAVGLQAADAVQSLVVNGHSRHQVNNKCAVPGGQWGKPENPGNSDLNLCSHGKALPQFVMLAHPKTATGSIAGDLVSANFACAGHKKEWNFCSKLRTQFGSDESAFVKEWFGQMPECSTSERQILGDFSPHALSRYKEDETFSWPKMLNRIYGPSVNKVVFGVILRERLARLHSHFYFGFASGNFRSGLEKALGSSMALLVDNSSLSDSASVGFHWGAMLEMGKYGEQLQAFLEELPASRFIITPIQAYTGNGAEFCGHIGRMLSYNLVCSESTASENSNPHPPLEQDSTRSLRERFNAFYAEDHSLLLQVLADAHKKGATLTKYVGGSTTVGSWLEKYW